MAMTVFFKKFIPRENFLFELKTLLHANPKIKWKESFPFAAQSWIPNPHHTTCSKPCKASHVAQGWRSPGGNYPADAGVGTLNSPKSNDIKVSSIFNNVSQSKNLNVIFHGEKKKAKPKKHCGDFSCSDITLQFLCSQSPLIPLKPRAVSKKESCPIHKVLYLRYICDFVSKGKRFFQTSLIDN